MVLFWKSFWGVNFSNSFCAGKKHDNEFSKLGWIGELNENKYGFWGRIPPCKV